MGHYYSGLYYQLLFWKLLFTTLQEVIFKIKRYDHCNANKNINGKQCTIIWHIDDLKYHMQKKNVVEYIIKNQ